MRDTLYVAMCVAGSINALLFALAMLVGDAEGAILNGLVAILSLQGAQLFRGRP